jgi:putative two-component system response regulator
MTADAKRSASEKRRILVVDDDSFAREAMRRSLRPHHAEWEITLAAGVEAALEALRSTECDVVLSDLNMPGRDGFDLLRDIRLGESTKDLPVIIITGAQDSDLKRKALDWGATDLLNKPVDPLDLISRLKNALRLKDAQDRLRRQNETLEDTVRLRTAELERARLDLIWRLARASEFRDAETGWHVVRVGYFSFELARALGLDPATAAMLFHTAPLHDVGKIGIPDAILLKPGRLSPEEWVVMQSHTRLGAAILRENVIQPLVTEGLEFVTPPERTAGTPPMVGMAANIALHHHERWDGSGYPEALGGDSIPIEARIVAVADVFDALSSRRPYKPAFEEQVVLSMIRRGAGTQFDPRIVEALFANIPRFREIQARFADDGAALAHAGADQQVRFTT